MPRRRKLTSSEEQVIIDSILDLDARSFPLRLRNVKDMANILLRERDGGRVGMNWASNFIKRQPALRTRLNRKIDYKRALYEDPVAFRKWFRHLESVIAEYGIAEENIYNLTRLDL